jgi:hypothetical protein
MSDKITIEDIIEFFEQDQKSIEAWSFTDEGAKQAVEELTRLRAQLAERDAMLAGCVRALEAIALPPDTLPSARDNPRMVDNFWYPRSLAREILASLPATTKANAKIIEEAEEQQHIFSCIPYTSPEDYDEACRRTNEAVRAKRELKP